MSKLAAFLIRAYQKVSAVSPPHCKYTPSCSEYARLAFLCYPFHKAIIISLFRLIRCNPFTQGGVDYLK